MPRYCYHSKVGAFVAAVVNVLVGGLTLGGAIYKVAIIKNGGLGLVIIMFLLSILLIHNGILLVIGIVMVDKALVLLFLVLNFTNWLVASFVIIKEVSSMVAIVKQIAFVVLIILVWCLGFVVYKFYKQMSRLIVIEDGDNNSEDIVNYYRKRFVKDEVAL